MTRKRLQVMKVEEGFVVPVRIEMSDASGNRVLPVSCQYVTVISSSPDIGQVTEEQYQGESLGFSFQPKRQGEIHLTILAKKRDGEFIRDWRRLKIQGPRQLDVFGPKPIFLVSVFPQED